MEIEQVCAASAAFNQEGKVVTMFRLFLVLLAVLAATPAFATDQYGQQNVQRVIVEYQPVQKVQKVQKQKVIIQEKVIVQDAYADYAAAVHAQNQANIKRLLNAAAKQALRDQAKSQSRRQRTRIVNRRGSSLNVQVNRGWGFGFF